MPNQRDIERLKAIDRQEEIDSLLKRLEIYRDIVATYVEQQTIHGPADTPPRIIIGIKQTRDEIRRVKGTLRGLGVRVDDRPQDEPPALTPSATPSLADQVLPSSDSTSERAPLSRPNDVFISYHDADEEWVSGKLLPLLENAGLKVIIDYRDFELGVPRLINIERAVESSQHTLIVMTPDWVEGEWEHFQALLAGSADPKGVRPKLIPLKLKPCAPPAHIAMLDYADLTKPARRDMQMDRLVRALRGSAITRGPVPHAPSAES